MAVDSAISGPVVEIDSENFKTLWPELQLAMRESTFIAIDAEMSGLGISSTFQRHAEDRYQTLKAAAQSRSLISLGMTCFSLVSQTDTNNEETPNTVFYKATSYNILMVCAESFMIDPSAVTFLTGHGFDFNKLFSCGLKYMKGNNASNKQCDSFARNIFEELVRVRKPIVVHNGFCDLIFMYECLYASCPSKLSTFMSDLSEIFPSGIYDTKVIAQFHERLNSSFLEYVAKTFHTKNGKAARKSQPNIVIELASGATEDLLGPIITGEDTRTSIEICKQFMKRGYCDRNGPSGQGVCDFSHNVTDIILFEEKKKRKRPRQLVDEPNRRNKEPKLETKRDIVDHDFTAQCHRAGIDSFFTGYSFAVFSVLHATELKSRQRLGADQTVAFTSDIPNLPDSVKSELVNRLYLNGHHPLWVTKSHFSKSSSAHEENIVRIFLGS